MSTVVCWFQRTLKQLEREQTDTQTDRQTDKTMILVNSLASLCTHILYTPKTQAEYGSWVISGRWRGECTGIPAREGVHFAYRECLVHPCSVTLGPRLRHWEWMSVQKGYIAQHGSALTVWDEGNQQVTA